MENNSKKLDRRKFLGISAKAVTAASLLPLFSESIFSRSENNKLKVVLIGTGSRGSETWGKEIINSYSDFVEIIALCDINWKRVNYAKRYLGLDVPLYRSSDFARMISETKPDAVVIATTDNTHAKYIIKSLELNCDVICEKPLVTDEIQAQKIIDAEKKSTKKIITTFNARHYQSSKDVKEVLLSGKLGKIISANYYEYLDVEHGASYFRRWHGKKHISGSLLVHKASHHFDQMNWWLDAEPVEVNAFGKVAFYGNNNDFRSQKCRGCEFKEKCDFYWDITENKHFMDMYVNCEEEDGYLRDGCVWNKENDSFDSMTVEVKYDNGVLFSYTLDTFLPYEGQSIAFNGKKGRMDIRNYYRQSWEVEQDADIRISLNFKESELKKVPKITGSHSGADNSLKDSLFKKDFDDKWEIKAGSRAGVMASLIGIAARKSIECGKRIKINDLVKF